MLDTYLNAAVDGDVISASCIAEYIPKSFTMIGKPIKHILGQQKNYSTFPQCLSFGLWFGIVWCWRSISCFRLFASLPYMSIILWWQVRGEGGKIKKIGI